MEPISLSVQNLSSSILSITSPASPCGVFSGAAKISLSISVRPAFISLSVNSLSKSFEFEKPFLSWNAGVALPISCIPAVNMAICLPVSKSFATTAFCPSLNQCSHKSPVILFVSSKCTGNGSQKNTPSFSSFFAQRASHIYPPQIRYFPINFFIFLFYYISCPLKIPACIFLYYI